MEGLFLEARVSEGIFLMLGMRTICSSVSVVVGVPVSFFLVEMDLAALVSSKSCWWLALKGND